MYGILHRLQHYSTVFPGYFTSTTGIKCLKLCCNVWYFTPFTTLFQLYHGVPRVFYGTCLNTGFDLMLLCILIDRKQAYKYMNRSTAHAYK